MYVKYKKIRCFKLGVDTKRRISKQRILQHGEYYKTLQKQKIFKYI